MRYDDDMKDADVVSGDDGMPMMVILFCCLDETIAPRLLVFQ